MIRLCHARLLSGKLLSLMPMIFSIIYSSKRDNVLLNTYTESEILSIVFNHKANTITVLFKNSLAEKFISHNETMNIVSNTVYLFGMQKTH